MTADEIFVKKKFTTLLTIESSPARVIPTHSWLVGSIQTYPSKMLMSVVVETKVKEGPMIFCLAATLCQKTFYLQKTFVPGLLWLWMSVEVWTLTTTQSISQGLILNSGKDEMDL